MNFAYTAVVQNGAAKKGMIEAESRRVAIVQLRQRGVFVTRIEEKDKTATGLFAALRNSQIWQYEIRLGAKVPGGEFAIFTRQLATLIRAGVTVRDGVTVIAQQTENKTFAKALFKVSEELQKGNPFSQAASEQKGIFPSVFVNMTRAGEASGKLDEVLDRMAIFFEREHYTREKVKSALVYPVFVSVLAVTVTVFLMVKVVPTFVGIFRNFHAQLPLPTRIILGASGFMVHAWYWLTFAALLVVAGYKVGMKKERGRLIRDTILLKLPIIGQLLVKSVMARMARTLSSLFGSAVPILQSLRLTANVVENTVVQKALQQAIESLTSGESLSAPLSKMWMFPPLVIHMIKIGEETGSLDYMLTKIADFYEAETEAMVDRLKSLLEPLMILFLASVVGTIILSMIMPMFSLYQQIGSMG